MRSIGGAVFALVLLAAADGQTNLEGFTAFFDLDECPSGWSRLEQAKGRLVLSVTGEG